MQSRYLRSRFLFGPHTPLLPPWSCAGEGKPRFGTTVAFTFLGGYNPRLDREDSSLLFFFFFPFYFYFWRGAPSNCLEHMLLPPATSDRESPFLHLSFSFPLSLLKVREWRRPISARLPFCEFNSEASPAFAWICLQTPRSLFSGCRGEAAASPGLRVGVFHIGALFGGL